MQKILLIATFLTSLIGFSQTLDPTFDTDGVVTNQITNDPSKDLMYDFALQSDGKILMSGYSFYSNSAQYFISRLNIDGSFDTTFNGIGFIQSQAQVLKIQLDGKILGINFGGISRYNTDGSIDTSFDTDGYQTLSVNTYFFYSRATALQTDGKIVIAGYSSNGTNNDFAVIRLNPDGSYDNTFNTNGKFIQSIGSGADEAFAVAIQSDGAIVVSGQSITTGTDYDFATIRITSTGVLDSSFGMSGKAVTTISGLDYGRALEIQPDGKIVVAGKSASVFSVVRYNANGTLDTTFNTTGKLITTTPLSVSVSLTVYQNYKPNIKYLTTGKILISGTSSTNYSLLQLNTDGSTDTTFGVSGVSNYNVDTSDQSCYLIVKPDGKILTGGSSYELTTNTNHRNILLQFSSSGVFELNLTKHLTYGNDVVIETIEQADGKTIVFTYNKFVRFNSNGSIDSTFGVNGIVNINVSFDLLVGNLFKQQADGKLLLQDSLNNKFYRYNSNGTLDSTFGTNGMVDMRLLTGNRCSSFDNYELRSDGKIYVIYDYDENIDGGIQGYSFGISLLNSNGTLDTTFGTNGNTHVRFNTLGTDLREFPTNLFIQSDGKIVIQGGFANTTRSTSITAVTRFNSNGTLDTSFGTNGLVTYNGSFLLQMIGLQDDKFLSLHWDTVTNKTSTLKFNSNGTFDASFGINGVAEDSSDKRLFDMVLQPDGKIIKGGSTSNNQFYITRLNNNGGVDTSFGMGGSIITPINSYARLITLTMLQSGKLLAGGRTFNGTNYLLAQARYTDLNLGSLDFNDSVASAMIYPNPIEQEAIFDFDLKTNENISVDIVDIQGKTVQTIVKNQELSAGNHKQNVNLTNLSSGNYILKFSSETGSQSIKIVKK